MIWKDQCICILSEDAGDWEHDSVISEIMGRARGAHEGGGSLSPSTKYKIDEEGEERGIQWDRNLLDKIWLIDFVC